MPHTYEEIRAASLDVLAERIPAPYGKDQYPHLKIGVAKALRLQSGESEPPPSIYPADTALETADADIFLEVFWDLFRDGIISLGLNDANKEFPFFRVTARGQALIKGDGTYFLHDVSGFQKQLLAKIPNIDNTTLLYLKEALQAFRSGCILSSSVMLGVATEHTFLLLLEAIEQNPAYSATFASVQQERTISAKINKFRNLLDQNKKTLPKDILDDFDTQFLAIQSLIRTFRNESGHPTGRILEREQAFVNLQLFVSFGHKAYQLIKYYSLPPIAAAD
jgi:hypothetical protein